MTLFFVLLGGFAHRPGDVEGEAETGGFLHAHGVIGEEVLAENGTKRKKRQKQAERDGMRKYFSENGCEDEKNESVCGKI